MTPQNASSSSSPGGARRDGGPNPYLRTKVLTASQEELRLMLFDGAIRFARLGREGLIGKDYEKSFEGITRCQAILMDLINSLRPEHDPDLCEKLAALYTFMYTRLLDASRQRDAGIVDEVLRLLEFERETWVMLMEQLAREAKGAAQSAAAQAAAAPPPKQSISVQG